MVIDQRAAEIPAARNLTPAQVSDERFLRELETAGFTTRLYGSAGSSPVSAVVGATR